MTRSRLRRWSYRCSVLALALLLLALAAGTRFSSNRTLWTRLRDAVREGRWDEAERHLDAVLARWPEEVEGQLLAARTARVRGNYAEAEARLLRAKELSGGATAPIQLEFVLVRVQGGEVDELVGPLQKLVEDRHPDAEAILETVARAYLRQLRYGPAFAILTRWAELYPEAAKPHALKGWVLERMGSPTAAIEAFADAIRRNPDDADARFRLADLYLIDTRTADARPHVDWLRENRPDAKELPYRLGLCLYQEGRLDEARPLLARAVDAARGDTNPPLALGRLELQANDPTAAERWLRHALRIDPRDPDALFSLSNCLTQLGQDAEAADLLARYRQASAELKRANDLLQEEAKTPTNDPDKHVAIGEALLKVDQDATGVYWLNRALELNSSHPLAHRRLAEYYERKGQPQQAAHHRKQATPADKR
jgi:tetratricopeptide (TPR) repeat protein